MLCGFRSQVIKCHAVSPWLLGTLRLWMFPLQTQLSCWEKSKPCGAAMCTFCGQWSSWTQPSSHHSPENRMKEPPDDPVLRPETPRITSMPCQNSAPKICGHNKMVVVLWHRIWNSLLQSNKWTITVVKLAGYLSLFLK